MQHVIWCKSTMSIDLEKQLTQVLTSAAKELNLTKYSLNLNLNAIKGDGFLGEFFYVSIKDEETGTTHHLCVKKAPVEAFRREQNSIEGVYKNEIAFYSQIYPAFRKFEEEHQVPSPFKSVPGYVTSNGELGKEMIVFKNIKKEGFVLREKDLLLDDEHARLIFKTYGHFHAISFCVKEQHPEEFDRLTQPLTHIWKEFGLKGDMIEVITKCAEKGLESFDPSKHSSIIEKFQKYINNTREIYMESVMYKGKYIGILHGDCWSNNMMFKYEGEGNFSQLSDMNLLDFQLVFAGPPVHDLSYFFYTGGSKQLFDKLEDYLDIYYDSFSTAAKNLGCKPEKLLPRHVLSEEWKEYCKFGMMLAIVLTKIKLTSKEDSIAMIDAVDQQTEPDVNGGESFMKIKYDESLFKQRVHDIILHMYEINAL